MSTRARSKKVWAVIIMTVCCALYVTWLAAYGLYGMPPERPLHASYYRAYAPTIAVSVYLWVAAYAVYRGYRWSLFLYQLILVYLGFMLVYYIPGLWHVLRTVRGPAGAGTSPAYWVFVFSMFVPAILTVAALFSAIVVYREIFSRREPDGGSQGSGPEQRSP